MLAGAAVVAAGSGGLPSANGVLAALHDEVGWDLYRRDARGGVDIYRKKVAGMAVPAFRGEKIVAADSELLFGILLDLDQHAGLSDEIPLTHSEVLSRQSNELDYVQYIDSPGWTLTRDRYWFSRARVERNLAGRQGHHLQTWEAIDPGLYPRQWRALLSENEDAVRVATNYGSWEVIPLGPKRSKLVYRVLSDAGGSLPKAVVLLVTARTLPLSMLQFEAEAFRRAGH